LKDAIAKCSKKTKKEICEIIDQFLDEKKKGNNWSGDAGKQLRAILASKECDPVAAMIIRFHFSTLADQTFDGLPSGGADMPTGTPAQDTTRPVDTNGDGATDSTDVFAPPGKQGTEKHRWAEEWRRWYHRGTNERPGDKGTGKPKTDATWIACRNELREKFVKSVCAFLNSLKKAKGG
jgi:hypothetical protein